MKAAVTTALILMLGLTSCGGDTENDGDSVIGGGHAQCDGQSPGTADSSPEVAATINTLVSSGATVRCTGKQSFQLNGRTRLLRDRPIWATQ